MQEYQQPKPKYWMFHNSSIADVFITTASKSQNGAEEKAKKLYPNEFEEYELDNNNYTISLFEITLAY